jgi:hypothetical protein
LKCPVDGSVSGHVPSELRLPVVRVGPRLVPVDRTGVPETAIDEHGDAKPGEGDIRPHNTPRDAKRQVLSEPQPAAVKLGAQR